MFRKLMVLLAAPALVGAQQLTDTTQHPISMGEAVRLANQNNVLNVTAVNAVRSANYSVRSAKAALIPSLTGTASQAKSAGQRVGPGNQLIDYQPVWSYNTGLTSQFTLFDAGKMFADIKTAQANVVAAQAMQVNTQYGVELNVKLAYNGILAAKESEAAARAQLDAAQAQLETSVAKVNAGAATVSDSLRSVVQVGDAQLALLQAQNMYITEVATLTHLVGTNYLVTADLADTVTRLIAIDSAAIMQEALTGPTIKNYQAQATAASASERSAKTAFLPTLSTTLTYGGSGTSALYGLNSNPYPYQRGISFNINYPIFNRFARENAIAAAQIAYQDAQAEVKDSKLNAIQSVISDIATVRNAQETMRVQEINVTASEEDLRVQEQRYNLGASVLLDVLNSQQALVAARQQLIQARLSYRNAIAQIEAAIGRDLQ